MPQDKCQVQVSRLTPREKVYAWLALVLVSVWVAIGCTPASLAGLLAPFVDDKIPPRCKITGDKEVTLVIVCNFSAPTTRQELLAADNDLSEKLGQTLVKRFKENKEKVKIVPAHKVRTYQNKLASTGVVSDRDIGQHFKADYVLSLDINSMDLYGERTRQLFRGLAEIAVRVVDLNKPAGEEEIFQAIYNSEYPNRGPIDAGNSSPMQFRNLFLNKVAKDLSRWFTSYPSEERFDTMD